MAPRNDVRGRFQRALGKLTERPLPRTKEYREVLDTVVLPRGRLRLYRDDFNKLLLCCDKNIVSQGFFDYFFQREPLTSIKEFEEGIDRFRTKAMLVYGNLQFAFRVLREVANSDSLHDFMRGQRHEEIDQADFMTRPDYPGIEAIDGEERWMLGQIAYDEEIHRLSKALPAKEFGQRKREIEQRCPRVRQVGKANLRRYLTLDLLDVYVATSMRLKEDFTRVATFVDEVFESLPLRELKLRYFDPTLSFSDDPRSTALVECLMLKRAAVTVYHAGERDTFGKDCELATTLAQGKPVVVYVEKAKIDDARFEDLEARAKSFDERHPLSLQVNVNTGVAHGVMVVRTPEDCAHLLYDILLGQLSTVIRQDPSRSHMVLRLNRKKYNSDSVIRIVTRDLLLSRAFWNYYFPRQPAEVPYDEETE